LSELEDGHVSDVERIESDRLILSPLTPEQGEAFADDHRDAQPWAPDFPTEGDLRQAHILRDNPRRAVGPRNPWGPYTLIERQTNLMIGGIGFKGSPDAEGSIEIGYGICPSRQGLGLMSEAVGRLCHLARAKGARRLTAETERANGASQRVLEKCGFERFSEENGSIWWHFELLSDEVLDKVVSTHLQ
jgi:RimJ/RimL family protein N-acetyltransferase